jgi:integrase
MRSACRRVGLEGVTFHTLRHTCASWLGQMSGVEALTIRDLLGHILVTVTIKLQMEQALLTVESTVNMG